MRAVRARARARAPYLVTCAVCGVISYIRPQRTANHVSKQTLVVKNCLQQAGFEGRGGEGREGKKGREGKGREGKGTEGKGREGKGREWKGREGKGREGKGREGKGREGKGREGKGREGKGREGKKYFLPIKLPTELHKTSYNSCWQMFSQVLKCA